MRPRFRSTIAPGKDRALQALAFELAGYWADDTPAPTEFRIFKYGLNRSEKGDFVFDEESAESVMAEYQRHNKPMLLDFNHGTTLEAATPEQAVAAGEFTPQIRGDASGKPELWAVDVKWTDRARAMVQAREYRLFSPFFEHTKGGRITRLINCALTNLPALDGIAPLMAASLNANPYEGKHMEEELKKLKAEVEELRAQLSAKTAECSALSAKLSAFEDKDKAAASAVALRSHVHAITGKVKDEEAIGVLTALKASHDRVAELEGKLAAIETTALQAEFDGAFSDAEKDGRITAAEKPLADTIKATALTLGGGKLTRVGVDSAKAALAAMPKRVPTGQHAQPAGGLAVSDAQRKVLGHMGIDPVKFAEVEAKRLSTVAR